MATLKPWPSRRAPMDAEASPLPRDETTPPVTKMYLVANRPPFAGRGTSAASAPERARRARRSAALSRHQRADAIEVLGGVDGDAGGALQGHHADADSVMEGAELLERFRRLQVRGG